MCPHVLIMVLFVCLLLVVVLFISRYSKSTYQSTFHASPSPEMVTYLLGIQMAVYVYGQKVCAAISSYIRR